MINDLSTLGALIAWMGVGEREGAAGEGGIGDGRVGEGEGDGAGWETLRSRDCSSGSSCK